MTSNFRRFALCACAVPTLLAAAPGLAHAQRQTVAFDIPAQDLADALRLFARQSGRQIIFDGAAVRGKTTPGLTGAHGVESGLDLLLRGSGLTARQGARGVLMVGEGAAAMAGGEALAEVVVTGTRLAPGKGDTGPANTYTAEAIARSGQTNLASFLNSLPEVSVGSSPDAFTGLGGQTTVRLRGLPVGATLVLLDGRRVASSAVGGSRATFDLNALATDLIERIDIVPVGSSAVYGSDAIGGVVNIVLRKRVDGVAGSVTGAFADGHSAYNASLGVGRTFSRGSFSLVGSYRAQQNLTLNDRALTRNQDFSRFAAQGGIDSRQLYCEPGTVTAITGTLNGVGVAQAGVPAAGGPRFAQSDFRATAGVLNRCNYYAALNMIPEIEGVSGLFNGEFELTGKISLYAQVFYSDYRADNTYPGFAANFTTPATNAFNPFGQAVRVSSSLPIDSGYVQTSEVFRPLVGARGAFGSGWSWDAAVWKNVTRDQLTQVVNNTAGITTALASADPATALNPFSPSSNSRTLLEQLYPRQPSPYRADQLGVDAVLRGRLLDLPTGGLDVALGFEGGQEKVRRTITVLSLPSSTFGERDTYSLFGEVRVPLIAGPEDGPPMLQAGLAGRYDHYSDFGGTTTPQASLEFRPLPRLSVRAAYSEAFKAPTLLQLFAGRTTGGGTIFDPRFGANVTLTSITGGNPDLTPETGKTSSLTVTWQDPDWYGLRLSASYFTIFEDNRIVQPSAATILENEDTFVGRVTRAPAAPGAAFGPATAIDSRFLNFGGLKLSGLDVAASFSVPLAGGVLTPSLALTRTLKYTSQIAPRLPFADRLAQATSSDVWAPRYKATLGAAWTGQALSLSGQGRYVGRYLDYQSPANRNYIGDYWTVDASAEVDLDAIGPRAPWALERFYARVSVSNLLDRGMRFSNFNFGSMGFDPTTDDFVGRTVSVTLGRRF